MLALATFRCIRSLDMTQHTYPILRYCSSYSSSISLRKIYPSPEKNSNADDLKGEFNGHIPMNEITKTFSCSSGPGGQNVNKVETKVDIRFHVNSATWLTPSVKSKILEKYGKDLTKDGWMVIKSDRTRSQTLNVADALEKLRMCIRSALEPPKPKFTDEEKEKIRKGKLKAARERLHFKRIRSDVNAGRKEKQVV